MCQWLPVNLRTSISHINIHGVDPKPTAGIPEFWCKSRSSGSRKTGSTLSHLITPLWTWFYHFCHSCFHHPWCRGAIMEQKWGLLGGFNPWSKCLASPRADAGVWEQAYIHQCQRLREVVVAFPQLKIQRVLNVSLKWDTRIINQWILQYTLDTV